MAMATMTQTRRPRRPKRRKRIASPKQCRHRNRTDPVTENPNMRACPPRWADLA